MSLLVLQNNIELISLSFSLSFETKKFAHKEKLHLFTTYNSNHQIKLAKGKQLKIRSIILCAQPPVHQHPNEFVRAQPTEWGFEGKGVVKLVG